MEDRHRASSLSHGSRGLVRGEITFVLKRTEAKNEMRLAVLRKIVFGNKFSGAIANPYCVESGLGNRRGDETSPEAVGHRVCGCGPFACRGKAPALACTQSVSGRDLPRGPARVLGVLLGRGADSRCRRPNEKPTANTTDRGFVQRSGPLFLSRVLLQLVQAMVSFAAQEH